jgi:hypothetical protein
VVTARKSVGGDGIMALLQGQLRVLLGLHLID